MEIFLFVLVGFFAQMVDGALGMAYGVSSNAFLLAMGIPPALSSASVHMAEVVTTAISGVSHWRLGNVRRRLFLQLLIPGVIGGVIGAYLLTQVDGNKLKPYISIYLIMMGLVIIWRAWRRIMAEKNIETWIAPLGLVGGFFDAIGGGGWGPVVTTTLVARGNNPRFTIGSVNTAEFFVTLAESITFIATLGFLDTGRIILGLLIGGAIAAPLAALVTKRLPQRLLLIMVGLLIIALNIRTLALLWLR
jgi:uncharacterized membrane protein YfcA